MMDWKPLVRKERTQRKDPPERLGAEVPLGGLGDSVPNSGTMRFEMSGAYVYAQTASSHLGRAEGQSWKQEAADECS